MSIFPFPILRPARFSDAEGIARTHIQSWKAAYANLMPPEIIAAHSLEKRTSQWREWLENKNQVLLWVAEQHDKVIGFVAGGPTRGIWREQCSGEIYALYLQPAFFGQGLGGHLFEKMKSNLEAEGHDSQWVWVLASNTKARGFYEKMGGIYQATTTVEIGTPPHCFEEVAYRFSGKKERAITP